MDNISEIEVFNYDKLDNRKNATLRGDSSATTYGVNNLVAPEKHIIRILYNHNFLRPNGAIRIVYENSQSRDT